jgi:tRNA/rRNA methyltransferase
VRHRHDAARLRPAHGQPREHFEALLKKELLALDGISAGGQKRFKRRQGQTGVAFLFGSERFGMANEDVYRCHVRFPFPPTRGLARSTWAPPSR